jgi:two-component system chemotaxis response regulator CheY
VRILVADDDATSRLIVGAAVRSLGHQCETVSDGTQAWDRFRGGGFDVVISDWLMPGQTGLQLCSNIRGHASDGYTYFIMVTAHGGADHLLEGMAAGADDYLLKPLNTDELRARLVSAARVTSLHRQLHSQRGELEALNTELSAAARRDPLTGLGNRRALQEDIVALEARVRRYGHRYCMAVLDIDLFKAYNDNYGHQAGDHVLEVVATTMRADARSGDALYRYGGEEFLCIFPEQTLVTATKAIERMRLSLERLRIPHIASPFGVLTFCAGLAMLEPDATKSTDEVLREADEALYRAKQLGRNRVEHAVLYPVSAGCQTVIEL